MKEIEKAVEADSNWAGELTFEGFRAWIKSDQKVSKKIKHAAIIFKEQELCRALFAQLDTEHCEYHPSACQLSLMPHKQATQNCLNFTTSL